MTDTPRTDAVIGLAAESSALIELCRQLERELAEARKALSDDSSIAHDHYQPQIDECIKEINELRAALAAIQLHAANTLSTASRDTGDWADDMAKIAGMAIKAQEAPK